MRQFLALSLIGAAYFAACGNAHAEMITADPSAIAKALQAAGYKAEMATDSAGDPMIRSASSGTRFNVYFYGCKEHKDCASIQFHLGYGGLKNVTLATLNDWHNKKRYGRAYLSSSGNVILEMDVDLRAGGMSPALFKDNLGVWIQLMTDFGPFVKAK